MQSRVSGRDRNCWGENECVKDWEIELERERERDREREGERVGERERERKNEGESVPRLWNEFSLFFAKLRKHRQTQTY